MLEKPRRPGLRAGQKRVDCTQVQYWVGGGCGEECEKKEEFAGKYSSETYSWTQKRNREDYGVHKYWVLLPVVKNQTPLKNNKYCCVHLNNLAG